MSPFERHGITHLSASSLNCYAEQPAFWALKYLHGYQDETGPAAWRGSAVEAGLDRWLFHRDLDEAIAVALASFEERAMGEADDTTEKERNSITPMLEQACIYLADRLEPIARQIKIEHWFDGIEVPLIGYVDYSWEDEDLDLKTTHRMPTEIPGNHARQVGLYSVARHKPCNLLYVTTKKGEIRPVEDGRTHVKRLEWYAHAVRRVLSIFPDKMDASRIFAPNFDHYFWKPDAARAAASQIWS